MRSGFLEYLVEEVLDGWVHYNQKGQHVIYDDDGNIVSEYY